MFFYDTCALLNELQHAFVENQHFLISSITLKELENIKTASNKDSDIKYKARRLIHLLAENKDKYTVIPYSNEEYQKELKECEILDENSNDSKIIITALSRSKWDKDIIFVTQDICCYTLARQLSMEYPAKYPYLKVQYLSEEDPSEYRGFKELICDNNELGIFYNRLGETTNYYNMLINEYLIIKRPNGEILDQYKYTENGFKSIPFGSCETKMFGRIKPKDVYQRFALDSMKTNKITMVRGAAGTGKSYLSFGFLFEQLEKHNIEKIIIFCNTVATSGSAKLGFYPGTRDEKLLDSQIGNLLASKLGDKIAVERMINEGTLVLLPMSDIRGYDTTGMRAGIYITEAQNLDIELMRLALQRLGEDSICILDGDSDTQVDLPVYAGSNNGMRRVSAVFRGDPCYGEVTLQNIHRSRIAKLAQSL